MKYYQWNLICNFMIIVLRFIKHRIKDTDDYLVVSCNTLNIVLDEAILEEDFNKRGK